MGRDQTIIHTSGRPGKQYGSCDLTPCILDWNHSETHTNTHLHFGVHTRTIFIRILILFFASADYVGHAGTTLTNILLLIVAGPASRETPNALG